MRRCNFVLRSAFLLIVSLPASQSANCASTSEAVEKNIAPLRIPGQPGVVPLTLEQLMRINHVPGLSVAVIDNFKIAWTKTYGTAVSHKKVAITTDTPFLAGSVSKSVTAIGMMTLVQRGKVSLDEDVNARLVSWKVPENSFTQNEKVTLRRITSHTAGLSVYGFSGYELGSAVPTVIQILDGSPPANSAPVRVELVPGSRYQYSGGGTTVEQLVLSDVSGQSFPMFMKEAVFDKVGMRNSTFEQPSSAAWAAKAAHGADGVGTTVKGSWHIFPEMAAAGLWTTPTDLSKLAIDVARARNGDANTLLSAATAREMLSPQPAGEGATIGFFVDRAHPAAFMNNGADIGFETMLRMDADTGQGAVLMANSENGFLVMTEYMRALARSYEWKIPPTPRSLSQTLVIVAKLSGIKPALVAYDVSKSATDEKERPNEQTLSMLGDRMLAAGDRDAGVLALEKNTIEYPKSPDAFFQLGKAYKDLSRKDSAVKSFRKVLELDMHNDEASKELSALGAK